MPYQTGTNLVVDLNGSFVLKLFPPLYRSQFVSERATLRLLDGKLSVPIPQVIAEGERDGWSYLIMSRLHGIVGSEAWPTLAESQKERVLRQVGQAIAEVQSVTPGELSTVEPSWPSFITKQVAGCIERHS
ncbi:aminoglycoside phosphotransferase family protein, partial [Bosea sp. LjRoot90]|uniref:aminoglycoside phosphotransferase family protein n=1 Tax=Bosea sp. LjRoot90 TaxID=3342342 RepID=UPI003F4FB2E7